MTRSVKGWGFCRLAPAVAFGALSAIGFGGHASGAEHVTFIGVAPDQEYREADAKLCGFLQRASGLVVDRRLPESYGDAINTVLDLNKRRIGYLARLTPYACVVAEMLGADFDILGTYQSRATDARTYQSYFVVNRESFKTVMRPSDESGPPSLADLREYLRRLQSSTPPKFIYHDKFSTSSYFLPSLYFRAERVFAMKEPTESLIAISVEKLDVKSSSALVEEVARGRAALAAVWDGTKTKYEETPSLKASFGNLVHFIRLETLLPNDLLVASSSLPKATRDNIHAAIRAARKNDERINLGDFAWWEDIGDAPDAREALARLRREAAASPAPVPVRVEDATDANLQELVLAARQAVRLAGTEFVLFDPDFHRNADIVWKLKLIHDGAVELTSSFAMPKVPPQVFSISFTSPEDLTLRIGALIQRRMHRIRYIWPYQDKVPTVIRDVDFAVPQASLLRAQRITWVDPARNEFNESTIFDTEVADSDFYKFELKPSQTFDFDPMSNAAYRVVLVRPSLESWWLKMLTWAFVGLLVLFAAAASWEWFRKPKSKALAPARDAPQ
jgi:ABC-type phosphate/phosphonate transport system substrate-binding protein